MRTKRQMKAALLFNVIWYLPNANWVIFMNQPAKQKKGKVIFDQKEANLEAKMTINSTHST